MEYLCEKKDTIKHLILRKSYIVKVIDVVLISNSKIKIKHLILQYNCYCKYNVSVLIFYEIISKDDD